MTNWKFITAGLCPNSSSAESAASNMPSFEEKKTDVNIAARF